MLKNRVVAEPLFSISNSFSHEANESDSVVSEMTRRKMSDMARMVNNMYPSSKYLHVYSESRKPSKSFPSLVIVEVRCRVMKLENGEVETI